MRFITNKYLTYMLSCIATCLLINYQVKNEPNTIHPDNKLSSILKFIEKEYIDSLDFNELHELAITDIISQLDPHSFYQPNIIDRDYTKDSTSREILGIEMFIAKI